MAGRLIYASNVSLDGSTEDAGGGFEWAPQDADVFAAITEIMRSTGTYLYGRRMYETMAVWETDPTLSAASPLASGFAVSWQDADKVVYSSTLPAPITSRTRVERRFQAQDVYAMKVAAVRDLLVGGPHLAAQALAAGLVDELSLFIWPIMLGGRNPALPPDVRRDLVLVDERRFESGVVHVRYRVTN